MTAQEYAQQAWQSDTVTPEIQRDYTENFLPAHAKSLKTKGLDKDAQITAGWRAYKKLAGEVEARNTQARQNLTDAQRRATPPSQTADVADSDVIVMFNSRVAMSAPTPANAAPDAAPQLQQPPRNPAATIRAAINRAYGKLLGQLEAKGLVTLAQTEAQAIEAAAQARAKKTGGDVGAIRAELMESVKQSAAMRLWVGSRTVNDAIIPEMPEYAGSTTGDLAYVPAGAKVPSGPIRVAVGIARAAHQGFGIEHMADNVQLDAAPLAACCNR